MLRRGFGRHCPVCGEGHLFRQLVRMAARCPRCGLGFHREDGQWLGSWFLNICVAQAAVVLVLLLGVGFTYPNPPMVGITALTVLAALAVPLAFFPFSRTIWSAIDLAMRPLDFDDGVAPGFELEADQRATQRDGRDR